MKHYIVFDNGGKTLDRYTIINKNTGDLFGVSENPYDSNGINQYFGNCVAHRIVLAGAGWRQRLPAKKVIQAEVENYVNNAKLDPSGLGFEVKFKDLPVEVCNYISRISIANFAGDKTNIIYMENVQDTLLLGNTSAG